MWKAKTDDAQEMWRSGMESKALREKGVVKEEERKRQDQGNVA